MDSKYIKKRKYSTLISF